MTLAPDPRMSRHWDALTVAAFRAPFPGTWRARVRRFPGGSDGMGGPVL